MIDAKWSKREIRNEIEVDGIKFLVIDANQIFHPGKIYAVNRDIKDLHRYIFDDKLAVMTEERLNEIIVDKTYRIG